MKNFLLASLFVYTLPVLAQTYGVINKDSKLKFGIKKFKIGKTVKGKFKVFSGEVKLENNKLKQLNGKVIVNSVDTGNQDRDKHLKSGEFFSTKSHPFMTFKLEGPINFKPGQEKKNVRGLLTIKGKEEPVKLSLKIFPGKKNRYIIIGSTKINRYDYGLTWNKRKEPTKKEESILEIVANFAKGLGDKYVLDRDVEISFRFEMLPYRS